MLLATSSNVYEAANAAARAQALASKYNIQTNNISGGSGVRLQEDTDTARNIWEVELFDLFAEHNSCQVLISDCGEISIVGQEQAANHALCLARAARSVLLSLPIDCGGCETSFLLGAVATVAERLNGERDARNKKTSSAALTVSEMSMCASRRVAEELACMDIEEDDEFHVEPTSWLDGYIGAKRSYVHV